MLSSPQMSATFLTLMSCESLYIGLSIYQHVQYATVNFLLGDIVNPAGSTRDSLLGQAVYDSTFWVLPGR